VATVPEFLAKQLLKQFGFPWHVAPGEAEAEAAWLQREGVVDAVMSDDVDTLMFGSGVTVRNWTPEGNTKTPTHVNVYRKEETARGSGLECEGMVLVALMSGGDYIPEGIPGCGPKVACDAARAGFGKELLALRRSDKDGLKSWRERLQHEIRTNESKFFSRKSKTLTIPEDFPNREVLGYYTHPCVSTPQKLDQLRANLRWDQDIDFAALRLFAADAFDWRCLGGAKKFIRNLAPAMLVRRLRLIAEAGERPQSEQEALEEELVKQIHGKRNHYTAGNELELRMSFIPAALVPIDLSIEDEEDDFIPAGRPADSDEEDDGFATMPSSTPAESEESEVPASPFKRTRQAKPYDPAQPEKLWILKQFLQLGAPLLVEDYEASLRDPKALFKQRRAARAVKDDNIHATRKAGVGRKKKDPTGGMRENALMRHVRVTKSALPGEDGMEKRPASSSAKLAKTGDDEDDPIAAISGFQLPSTQVPAALMRKYVPSSTQPTRAQQTRPAAGGDSIFAAFAKSKPSEAPLARRKSTELQQRTPTKSRKRRSPELSTPRAGRAVITAYFSPTPKASQAQREVISLLSSSPVQPPRQPIVNVVREVEVSIEAPAPLVHRAASEGEGEDGVMQLPSTVTKRRRRGPLRKSISALVQGEDSPLFVSQPDGHASEEDDVVERMDLASPTPRKKGTAPRRLWPASDDEEQVSAAEKEGCLQSFASSLPTPPAEDIEDRTVGRAQDLDQTDESEEELPDLPAMRPAPTRSPRISGPPRSDLADAPAPARKASAPKATATGRRPPPPLASRANPAPASTAPSAAAAPPKANKTKNTHILLRPSLDGAWKKASTTEVEQMDLTGDSPDKLQRRRRAWRLSKVEVMDLTTE